MNVNVFVKKKSVWILLGTQLVTTHHRSHRAEDQIVLYPAIGLWVVSLAIKEGFSPFVGTLRGKTVANSLADVFANRNIGKTTFPAAAPQLEGILVAIEHVALVAKIFLMCFLIIGLGGNACIVNLIEITILYKHTVAAAPILNGVAIAREIIAPRGFEPELDRTTYKCKRTVPNGDVLAASRMNCKARHVCKA